MTGPLFFLSQDNSGHWYVVPREHEESWNKWNDIPEDDPTGWEHPDWAYPLGGSPSLLSFTRWIIND